MTRTRITTDGITDASVTYAKVQNVAADRLLGRAGTAGVVQEIVCTSAGRALIDDADAATQRATLGLGAIIDVGGNVGIGTTSPTARLDVRRTNNYTVLGESLFTSAEFGPREQNDGFCSVRYSWAAYGSGNNWAMDCGSDRITFAQTVANVRTEMVTFRSSGNVGIGTNSPSGRLHVSGSTVGNCNLRLSNTAAGGRTWEVAPYSTGVSDEHFCVRDVTASANRLVIDASGNVGIGTASPAVNLHVADATAPDIRVSGAGPSLDVFTDTTTGYVGTTSNHPLALRTNNVDRWRMGSDGSLQTTAVGDTNNTLRPAGHIRAWARFNGVLASPITPVRSFNVTSVTKNGTGSWTLNLQTPLSSDNGVAVASGTDTINITALGQVNNMSQAVVASSIAVRVTLVDQSNIFVDAANISAIVCDL